MLEIVRDCQRLSESVRDCQAENPGEATEISASRTASPTLRGIQKSTIPMTNSSRDNPQTTVHPHMMVGAGLSQDWRMYTYIHILCVYIYVSILIYMYMCIYTHMYIYTYIYPGKPPWSSGAVAPPLCAFPGVSGTSLLF